MKQLLILLTPFTLVKADPQPVRSLPAHWCRRATSSG